MIQPFPLKWPKGWPRTSNKQSSRFSTTLAQALDNVDKSLKAFGKDSGQPIKDIVITSNVTLGRNNPEDSGVAVWFTWEGNPLCIAVDRYSKVQENLQAIHFVIESRRTELRHGGLHLLRQAFAGFKALPAGDTTSCWDVLKISKTNDVDSINRKYRELSKQAHPDGGGSAEQFKRLTEARDEAILYAEH